MMHKHKDFLKKLCCPKTYLLRRFFYRRALILTMKKKPNTTPISLIILVSILGVSSCSNSPQTNIPDLPAPTSISISLPIITPTALNDQRTTILFTGDINLGRCVALKSMLAHDFTYPFEHVADKLTSADITVGSLDGSLSDQSDPMPCPYTMNFIAPSKMVEGLQLAGFDIITIATNHSKDCGEKGWNCNDQALLDTLYNLNEADISSVGGGSTLAQARAPIIITHNNIRFAFLGINQIEPRSWAEENKGGTSPLSEDHIEMIKQDIVSARSKADVVILLVQWGTEYTLNPKSQQREWAKIFTNAGAALIIGNHPHVTQPIEKFPQGIVFYSLGNFVFDQPNRSQRESIVVEATFNGTELESWNLIPAYINFYTFQTHWASGAEIPTILERAKILNK